MANVTSALGSNGAVFEALALKIVGLIEAAGTPLETGAVALKLAQVILDAKQREAWDEFGKMRFNWTWDVPGVAQGLTPDSEA